MYKMVFRDTIIEIVETREPDGRGGSKVTSATEKPLTCKASFNTSPEVMNAYGTHGEGVLYISSLFPLNKDSKFRFKSKTYSVRFQSNNNRLYFSTLVEIK